MTYPVVHSICKLAWRRISAVLSATASVTMKTWLFTLYYASREEEGQRQEQSTGPAECGKLPDWWSEE